MKKLRCILAVVFVIVLGNNVSAQPFFEFGTATNPKGESLYVDSKGFLLNGKRILPVMGEIHFSRVPEREWETELLKMKGGGVTIISTYIFWNHHNDEKDVWEWDGNKNLRRFAETCDKVGMPLVIRIGPFCHGEVYQGGFPVWVVDRCQKEKISMRSADKRWLEMVHDLYSHIFDQVKGLFWKDGGPIIGVQLENECRGPWPYMQALKDMAIEIGYDVPFFTRTGWPRFNGKPVFGEILPLYGDYADGFWDRELTDMPSEYKQAFEMREAKVSATIATEQFSKEELQESAVNGQQSTEDSQLKYPYFTCELGGGMMTSYHRRINIFDKDALALAVCKVGCGSNLPGYYMYHGGTNPDNPNHNMAEMQSSPVTNYNDLPHKSYDFQSPLGEIGQVNESFHMTRIFHQFLADWGSELAEYDTEILSKHLAKRGPFMFYNDYVRIINPDGMTYWKMYGVDGVDSVSAMPFCKTSKYIYYVEIPGVKARVYGNHSKKKIKILTYDQARKMFKIGDKLYESKNDGILYKSEESGIVEEYFSSLPIDVAFNRIDLTNIRLRDVKMGINKAAEQPSDEDFENAAVWEFDNKFFGVGMNNVFLKIYYHGDVARVYADGKLVEDNFWNGKPFYVRLSDIADKKVEIKILPLGKKYPIYFQPEQKKDIDNQPADMIVNIDKIELVAKDRKFFR